MHYEDYKKIALKLVTRRLAYFNKTYSYAYNKITIKRQKTRWGSCSQKKNLNFNYKIVFLPSELSDYIIVHELCHLNEFNHSSRFWKLVYRAIPDYSNTRARLRLVDLRKLGSSRSNTR